MSEKKPSLFKQRMKEMGHTGPKPAPEVFKITLPLDQPAMQVEPTIQKDVPPAFGYTPILKSLTEAHLIQSSEYDEISKENDRLLEKLTPQQIEEMQRQIQQEMSPAFLEKLFTATHSTPLRPSTGSGVAEPEVPLQPVFPQPVNKSLAEIKVEQSEHFELHKALCERMNKLCVNPTTGELTYSDEECPTQLVNLGLIKRMVESGNNQSIVTGLTMLIKILNSLTHISASYGMIIIGQYYWHIPVLLDFIRQTIIVTVLKEYNENSFKTCRIQCIETLLTFAIANGFSDKNIIQHIKQQAKQFENVANLSQLIQQAKPSLQPVTLWRKLQSQGSAATMQELFMILNNPATLLEKLMIEHAYYPLTATHAQPYHMMQYYNNLLSLTVTYPDQNRRSQLQNAISLLYRVAESCVLKLKIHEEVVVRSFLKRFGQGSQRFLTHMLNSSKSSVQLYRILFILKKCSKIYFIQLLNNINEHKLCRDNFKIVEPILCFINIKEYLAEEWPQQQLDLFGRMLLIIRDWTNGQQGYISMDLILLQLIKLFRATSQGYQNLDQTLLDNVFNGIINHCNPAVLAKIIDEHMSIVKKLVMGYIYNSFGNLVYSKLLVFLSSNLFSAATQIYIITECYQRYPFIFFEAGKTDFYGLTISPTLYNIDLRPSNVKEQLNTVLKMFADRKKDQSNNSFLRLLRS